MNVYAYVDSVGKPPLGTNLYAYTENNPVNWTDPLGLEINSTSFDVDLFVVGAGTASFICRDDSGNKRLRTYKKGCYGLSLFAKVVSFGAPVKSLTKDMQSCPPEAFTQYEVGGAIIGGVSSAWGDFGTATGPAVGLGGGFMKCSYLLDSDIPVSCNKD